eukprot:GHVS01021756.1.p1 GENE.GHVS01021756.1~~GHVS01021756.1.p1  ORF type:complete len:565 (+),score=70.46 GHVS01021756.1:101-1795(+)
MTIGKLWWLVGLSSVVVVCANPHSKGGAPDIASPIKLCPRGFVQNGKMCVKTLIKSEERVCPKKATLDRGVCVVETEVAGNLVCPDGFDTVGKNCEAVDSIGAYIECPKGYVLSASSDSASSESACIRTVEGKAELSCPEGFKSGGGMSGGGDGCVSMTKVKATQVCPNGSEATRRGCVVVESVAREISCPMGYTGDGAVGCVKLVPTRLEERCPKTYKKDDAGGCVMSTKTRAMEVCAPGSFPDGLKGCVKETSYPATPRCRKDFKFEEGKCIKVVQDSPSYDCGHGAETEGSMCVTKSHSRAEYVCSDGSLPRAGNYCEAVSVLALELSCSNGGILVDGKCVKKETRRAERACPHGFKDVGDACTREKVMRPQEMCNDGFILGRSGDCMAEELMPAVQTCKTGSLSSSGSCIEIDTVAKRFVCPNGYRQEGAAGNCVRKMVLDSREVCPLGSVSKGSKCVVEERLAPTTECTHGFKLSSQGCVKVIEKEPEMTCPVGYKMLHGLCLPKKQLDVGGHDLFDGSGLNPLEKVAEGVDKFSEMSVGRGTLAGAAHKVVSRFLRNS